MIPKGRETIYKGVRFKSRLEADYAGDLDGQGWSWKYEPCCFAAERAGAHVQYLPDFLIWAGEEIEPGTEIKGQRIYCEVKPPSFPLQEDFGRAHLYPLLERMEIIWDTEPTAILWLVLWRFGMHQWDTIMVAHGEDRVWTYRTAERPTLMLMLAGMGQWTAVADRHFDRLRKAGAVGQ